MKINKAIITSGFILLGCTSLYANAETAATSAEVSPIVHTPKSQDGGYFELGVGFEYTNEGLYRGSDKSSDDIDKEINLGGGYQWHGAFFEFYTAKSDVSPLGNNTLLIGYKLLDTEHWVLDLVAGPENGEITEESASGLSGISDRDLDVTGGLRATGYWGNTVVQLMGRTELTDRHDGESFSGLIGHAWQIGNVQTHAALGMQYSSKEIVNYYLGVGEEDDASGLASYSADASLNYTAEFGLAYALSEHWLLRSQVNYAYLSKEMSESPILDSDNRNRVSVSLTTSYVF